MQPFPVYWEEEFIGRLLTFRRFVIHVNSLFESVSILCDASISVDNLCQTTGTLAPPYASISAAQEKVRLTQMPCR